MLVILGIALLVFEPKKLPELHNGLGDGIRVFRAAYKDRSHHGATERDRSHPQGIESGLEHFASRLES